MSDLRADPCPDARLDALVAAVAAGADVAEVDALLAAYPGDARLHFLRGSLLAGGRRYPEARAAVSRAVALAPGFDIARFQLGFLEFTSGEPELARRTWRPLQDLEEAHPLSLFARGLLRLVDEDVTGAIALLRRGMAANTVNPPLNQDMATLLAGLEPAAAAAEPVSETELLLRQFGGTVRH
ncbi:hypothetical protein GCM10017620_31230 [Brevundimonas intermedia]|uniref:Tetratricopeptide repeat protein n=1 Tax=Brevundimonas intermedia TaxID=74315 RepID=A0ABQ5TBF1_9CAUL|nr:tetratricopeptide repeat protein [Brevundimonas intermedia]GLK50149.1 hypothetical protein GCM10017620_31230 [Brevundimonas intermedia]